MSLLLSQGLKPYQQQALHCRVQILLEPPGLHCSSPQAVAAALLVRLLRLTVPQLQQLLGWVLEWEQVQP
jgi:hypothetical protein